MACRFGGDEFVLVLPNTPVDVAARRADVWRASLAESSVYWIHGAQPTTVSLGVAEFPTDGTTTDSVLAAADAAMYAAKADGRNRCVVAHCDLGEAASHDQ
jgi:diguanylate cyclase (GGDEF)-like protein